MGFPNNFCYGNSSYTTDKKYDYLRFRNMCTYYLSWILPLVILVGILGSVFCLVFLLCSKLFPKNLLIWLVSICVADLMILLLDGVWMLLKMWLGFDIRDVNDFFCVAHKFLSNYFFYWSAYMQTMVSIQRAYLIMKPLQARATLILPRLLIVWLVLSVLMLLPHVTYVIKFRVRNGDCDPPSENDFHIPVLCDLIIWGIIPFTAMTISTCIICINVCSFQSRSFGTKITTPKVVYNFVRNNPSAFISTAQRTVNSESSSANSHSLQTTRSMTLSRLSSPEITQIKSSPAGRKHGGVDTAKHVTQLLISMNFWYLITTFPLLIYLVYLNFVNPELGSWRKKFFYYLLRSFSFYNACSNWVFYCAAGKLFRNTAKQLILRMVCSKCFHGYHSSNSQASIGNINPSKYYVYPRKC